MIIKTPGVCGGSARIRNTRIPIWLIKDWVDNIGYEEILKIYPELGEDDIRDSLKYYEDNKEEIEKEIRQNE